MELLDELARDMDTLLAEILNDIKNLDADADVSKGSTAYMFSAALAAVDWGERQNQKNTLNQVHPQDADRRGLEKHAARHGLVPKTGETDDELLARIEIKEQEPSTGGNDADYRSWALEIADVALAKVYRFPRGIGTLDVLIIADKDVTGSEIPNQQLLDDVEAKIESERPSTVKDLQVVAPSIKTQDVTMAMTGGNTVQAAADVAALLENKEPDEILYLAQLISIGIQNGASNVSVTTPAGDVAPAQYEMLRPGMVTVNAS